jgi:hypothetical protein
MVVVRVRKSCKFGRRNYWVIDVVDNMTDYVHPNGTIKSEYVDYITLRQAEMVLILFKDQRRIDMHDSGKIRQFDSGATRDTDIGKLNYEGFLSPLVIERYAQYLHKHRVQSDGNLRDADNWQKGIPIKTYMEGKVRHGVFTWLLHRGFPAIDDKGNKVNLEDSLCAEIFNAMGYLFELLKEKDKPFVCPAGWKIVYFDKCGWWVKKLNVLKSYLHKNLIIHVTTGYSEGYYKFGEAPGYWPTKEAAEAALAAYLEKEKT